MKRILIVDDSKEVREIVRFVLECYGFEVVEASDGLQLERIVSVVREDLPNLIILDVMMPGEDGFRICEKLRTNVATKHIPIMIITAHTEGIYERISVDLGVASHMTKPFHPLELAERVQRLVNEQN